MSNDTNSPTETDARLDILGWKVDRLAYDQLATRYQLWVYSMETILATMGVFFVIGGVLAVSGYTSIDAIAWLETLVDITVGLLAVVTAVIYVAVKLAELADPLL
jgi:hypothetical protein